MTQNMVKDSRCVLTFFAFAKKFAAEAIKSGNMFSKMFSTLCKFSVMLSGHQLFRVTHHLCTLWMDFDDNRHKYSSREWALLRWAGQTNQHFNGIGVTRIFSGGGGGAVGALFKVDDLF